jgi:hypothetical protein
MARLIFPVRTFFEEDSVFVVASGELEAELSIVGLGRPMLWPRWCGGMFV